MDGSTAAGFVGTDCRPRKSPRPQPLFRELSLLSVISSSAGFGLTTIYGSSISPPARADIPRLIASFARGGRRQRSRLTRLTSRRRQSAIANRAEHRVSRDQFHCADIHSFGAERTHDLRACARSRSTTFQRRTRSGFRHAGKLSRDKVMVADTPPQCWLAKVGIICLTTLSFPRTDDPKRRLGLQWNAPFSFRELAQLATAAGWHNFGHRRFLFLPGRRFGWNMRRANEDHYHD